VGGTVEAVAGWCVFGVWGGRRVVVETGRVEMVDSGRRGEGGVVVVGVMLAGV